MFELRKVSEERQGKFQKKYETRAAYAVKESA